MGDLIVKDNALINASYNLEVSEQRLILLSIVMARETGIAIDATSTIRIHASDYMQRFGVDKHAAYEALKNAVHNLFGRQFSYSIIDTETGKKKTVKSRWVQKIAYIDDSAILEVAFTIDVVPLITRLEQNFTSYQLKQVSQLTSKYAIRLYEMLIAWRDVEKTPVIEISDFRYKLGLAEHEYKAMNHFKSRVLEPAIEQINKFTDINAEYEQFKSGRVIVGFQFKFTHKRNKPNHLLTDKDLNTPALFNGLMTEKQILLFANKLAYDHAFSSKFAEVGEEYKDVEMRLIKKLAQPEFVQKYLKDLERLGFKI